MPESASEALALAMATLPSRTGLGLMVGASVGTVRSIWTVTRLLGALVLSATSLAVWAVELTALPSPLRVWSGGQLATPESASAEVNCTVTGALWQPAALGAVVAAALMLGAVRSIAAVTTLLSALVLPATSLAVCAV